MISKKISTVVAATTGVVLTLCPEAPAHVRWFVDGSVDFPEVHYTMDLTNWLVLGGGVLFFLVACLVHRSAASWKVTKSLDARRQQLEPRLWRLVALLSGAMLLINTAMKIYLAPNLSLSGTGITWFGLGAQALVGILLVGQISFSISGVLIYVAAVLAILFNPLSLMIDYLFEFAALGLCLILVGPGLSALDRKLMHRTGIDLEPYQHFALPVIRVGVGLSLVILAIHNKFMNPSMIVAFLDEYHLNFMPYIGFQGFSNLHYSFSAGVAETTIGLLVILGIATRFTVLALTIFFISTLIVLAPMELVGHLPLFGIAFLLIGCGGGSFRARSPSDSHRG
ncbi:MAG: DoxX family protein [Verrucomicrobiales bacterium]